MSHFNRIVGEVLNHSPRLETAPEEGDHLILLTMRCSNSDSCARVVREFVVETFQYRR